MGSSSGYGSEDLKGYSQDVLYKAALRGDWETAESIFDKNICALTAVISVYLETPLHIAVSTGKANGFVKKLVDKLPPPALAIQDDCGETALHNAARVGNTEAAKDMLTRNPELLYILSRTGRLPVLQAAVYGNKDTLDYLLSKSKPKVQHSPFQGQIGVELLNSSIASQFFDVALDLVQTYPDLARLKCQNSNNLTPLLAMTDMATCFLSGERFSCWEKWIYHRVSINANDHELTSPLVGDIESGISEAPKYNKHSRIFCGVFQKLEFMLWKVIRCSVPCVEEIRKKKAVHQQTLELVKCLCQEMLCLPQKEASQMFLDSIAAAAKYGISEMVEVIMDTFPMAIYARQAGTKMTIIHLAAKYRFENVFNLHYNFSDRKYEFFYSVDNENNNLMHICGKIAPSDRLNLVRGAALQMQRELQWYNEVEKLVHPSRATWLNEQNMTPKMLFTEAHKQLKVEGEKWMKATANACTISAALIATVMFAAIFTVPGGVDKGIPVFSSDGVFTLFAITDAVSLFTSITSLLMFLSILTSRYAEQDFLYVLPKRVSIGLLSLFVSITFMMIAFTAALYFVFKNKGAWLLILVAALGCMPVTSFVLLQFPLLVEIISSTYGPGIFGKKTDSILY